MSKVLRLPISAWEWGEEHFSFPFLGKKHIEILVLSLFYSFLFFQLGEELSFVKEVSVGEKDLQVYESAIGPVWSHPEVEQLTGLPLEFWTVPGRENELQRIRKLFPKSMTKDFSTILPAIISSSIEFKVDPLWVLALMWTESHFRTTVVSSAGAVGLMQILPGTAVDIARKLDRPIEFHLSSNLLRHPQTNIRFGVFYLRHLLNRFGGDYRLASLAYNEGPSRLRRKLRRRTSYGNYHQYWRKISRRSKWLSDKLSEQFLSKVAMQ